MLRTSVPLIGALGIMPVPSGSSAPLNWKRVAVFTIVGTVGPMLTLILKTLDFKNAAYHYLYELIAAICPAWFLGVYEYKTGPTIAGVIVLFGNVFAWFLLGLALAGFGHTKKRTVVAIGAIVILCAYVFWALRSITATVSLALTVILVLLATRSRHEEST